ncbi:MAG TPA: hypothetical protein DCR35_06360 [Runella sp.]|nr:hypothetical protein [Runella sp.]HAO48938.1 hypothetical protein [Runella sp.]
MKTTVFFATFCIIVGIASLPYFVKEANGDNISISVSDSDDMYKVSADYPKDKARNVQKCLDKCLDPSGMSFVNAEIDGDINPGNGMFFHIKSSPGKLRIKFDKRKNSASSLRKMKQLGEELKKAVL